jgi:CheY-like chemotaxis protein
VICFKISDTGIGISPEKIEGIFQPFEQLRDPRIKAEGTGLGLTISQTLVRMMGGDLHVTSTVGQGTTFWFELILPISDGRHIENGHRQERRIIGYKGPCCKVLVADDKPENRTLVIDMLAPLGFEILEADNGADALDKAQSYHPNVMLIDLVMPVLDGFEVIRRIRQLSALSDIIIISVSASVLQETQQASATVGTDDFLAKPINMDELLTKLHTHLHLEWEYEQNLSELKCGIPGVSGGNPQSPNSKPQTEIVPPPPEALSTLYQLTSTGKVIRLREHLEELIAAGSEHVAFGHMILDLARDVRLDEIEQILQEYMDVMRDA